ncbi:MAG: DUF4358 domain-containing protein, partial [Clostridia bacterium]|nr:DUF4358 domain-containing protein [Clostridia bacterium]
VCGCGENVEKIINIDAEALASELSEIYANGEIELLPLNSESSASRYGIDKYSDFIYAEASVTVTSDEIVVVRAIDKESAETVYEILKNYCEERAELFGSYAPDQVPKLEDALLERAGKYVVLVVSEDTSEAEKIWNKYRS